MACSFWKQFISVHISLLYDLCVCACDDFLQALEKAKEATKKERVLVRQREQYDSGDNLYLTYSVSTAAREKLLLFVSAELTPKQDLFKSVLLCRRNVLCCFSQF